MPLSQLVTVMVVITVSQGSTSLTLLTLKMGLLYLGTALYWDCIQALVENVQQVITVARDPPFQSHVHKAVIKTKKAKPIVNHVQLVTTVWPKPRHTMIPSVHLEGIVHSIPVFQFFVMKALLTV